jgi:hypothetical protein
MTLRLPAPHHRVLAMVAAMIVCTASGYLLQRHYRAAAWSRSADAAGLQRSLALESQNADVLYALARMQLYADQDPARARETLRHAVALNPHSAWYWLDLSIADQQLGDEATQSRDLLRASAADPRTPVIAWETANFYLVSGDNASALQRLRTVIENDPNRSPSALRLAWRATGSTESILTQALPDSAPPYLQFIDVLLAERRTDDAMHVWSALKDKHFIPESPKVGRFVEYLLREQQVYEAVQVCRDLEKDPSALKADPMGNVDLVDPGFEDDGINGGFAWRIAPPASVTLAFDDDVFYHGNRSLRLDFNGDGMSQPGISRLIPVEPGATYHVITAVRSEGVRSADIPHWIATDAYTHKFLGASAPFMSQGTWQDISFDFTAPADTRLITLLAFRDQSQTLIKGTIWLDDLRMVKR